ncbi:hypothetical protein BPNPMPFG_005042 [Mesorhizobium sp. AR07]|uniref:hypothetical protein n=1 Tax=Mesorhizobium sp. AR07 TaxID=2865838 RepID=UPI00215F0AD7|nr:hypothetical protein [Mesorhizobium sp. AR07]UVK43264.1 hypothetical protein BPNPMPFG_005042 [Mesorhizobium sp. AR07]
MPRYLFLPLALLLSCDPALAIQNMRRSLVLLVLLSLSACDAGDGNSASRIVAECLLPSSQTAICGDNTEYSVDKFTVNPAGNVVRREWRTLTGPYVGNNGAFFLDGCKVLDTTNWRCEKAVPNGLDVWKMEDGIYSETYIGTGMSVSSSELEYYLYEIGFHAPADGFKP